MINNVFLCCIFIMKHQLWCCRDLPLFCLRVLVRAHAVSHTKPVYRQVLLQLQSFFTYWEVFLDKYKIFLVTLITTMKFLHRQYFWNKSDLINVCPVAWVGDVILWVLSCIESWFLPVSALSSEQLMTGPDYVLSPGKVSHRWRINDQSLSMWVFVLCASCGLTSPFCCLLRLGWIPLCKQYPRASSGFVKLFASFSYCFWEREQYNFPQLAEDGKAGFAD